MSKIIRERLATIAGMYRRAVWEEPNLQYDGTEPPGAWLGRLKQLKQIHGYNDRETVHVAERCLNGPAQLWFRIHQPTTFDALRTGLHTRFASGPVLIDPLAGIVPRSARRSYSTSPLKDNLRKIAPSVVQWDVAADSVTPNRPDLVLDKPIVSSRSSHADSPKESEVQGEQIHSDAAYPRQTAVRNKPGVLSEPAKSADVKQISKNLRGSQQPIVSHSSAAAAINNVDIQTITSTRNARNGDLCMRSTKPKDVMSISLSTMSHPISAKDLLEENGAKSLPASCKGLPINWQEALLKFKHAIRQAMRGDWTQMSLDFCKYYLRCYGLRMSGSKTELIHRIRDHLELTDGSGAHKYPRNTFIIDCAGVVCLGDVILFEQKLQAGFDVLNGNQLDKSITTVVGRVVKDFKSLSSHQQEFTVEVYWSKGQSSFRPMVPLRIAARDLFALHPLRQRWMNEDARKGLLDEKKKLHLERKATCNLQVSHSWFQFSDSESQAK